MPFSNAHFHAAAEFDLSDGAVVCIEPCDSGESVQGELLVIRTVREDCVGVAQGIKACVPGRVCVWSGGGMRALS